MNGHRVLRAALAAVTAAAVSGAVVTVSTRDHVPAPASHIGGPYATLLAASADLGPARGRPVQLTAELRTAANPHLLRDWATRSGVSLRWRDGDRWAVVEGPAGAVARAFGVDLNEYRHPDGTEFYASPEQPDVPAGLRGEVAALGRILGYTPYRETNRWRFPSEVPGQGLDPQTVLRAYNIQPLHDAGFTGKGSTVVVFAFDGFDQADLDTFADTFSLPRFTPEVIGGQPAARRGEANMDLQAIHAIAPDATKVLVNARSTVEGGGSYEKIAAMFEDADRRYPGAVWSLSIGWGCDKLITAADLVPVRAALVAAQERGTTAFDASGDLAGLECKGGSEWSAPPDLDDIGLDAVASLPEMVNVGGTTLSTDDAGRWLDEQAWFDAPLSQGTAGGESALFERPRWQVAVDAARGRNSRLTPDVSAVADPFTGVKVVFDQQVIVGGGTSLSAPLWAGMAAVINQYLAQRGEEPLGDLNPLLYRLQLGTRLPAFQDVVRGGNAVNNAGPGYDLVTGLGTPNVQNLATVLFEMRKVTP